jgi:hypothetical protein
MMYLTECVKRTIERKYGVTLSPLKFGPSEVDFAARLPDGRYLIIEHERRREDPVNNVAKVWRHWAESRDGAHDAEGIFFVHIFSGYYNKGTKYQNAKFIGEKLEEWGKGVGVKISYTALAYKLKPDPGDSDPFLSPEQRDELEKELLRVLPLLGN